jgi:multidrug efflux pump subunit AcrA (membrane-fusion protein)
MKFIYLSIFLISNAYASTPPRNETTVPLGEAGVKNLGIETIAAEESTFEQTISVLGEIDHTCESHSVLSSRIPGKIIQVGIHKGEFVKKGDVLLRIESRQPGDPPPIIDLKAPADGLVIKSEGHLGAPVEPESTLMEIMDISSVWVIARVPQHHAALLNENLTAIIRIPSVGDKIHKTKFLRLGTETTNSSTVDAIFEIQNPDYKIRPGMRAELSLITSKRENVFSIPRAALLGDRANRFVFIKDYELENTFVRTPVVVGEMSDERVEIISGLFPGDEVVIKGAYSLAFAGKGNVSLKEALDAAHGHPHNEDGTEMTAEEIAASNSVQDHGHDHRTSDSTVIFLGIISGVLLLLLIASVFLRKPQNENAA